MRLADLAWREISAETIANCWMKSGILPSSSSATTAAILADLEKENEAEAALLQTLDGLNERGVLQRANRLDLESLVDMPEEQVMEDATDEEIFEAVQQLHSDRENLEQNTGDDGDESALDLKPTRKEALQAVSMLRRYLQDEEGSFARKLEVGLASFGRETRLAESKSLIATSITDYFSV
ncbi:hypothetical protein C8R47DRAFT_434838 [Mycena vitilis]|nr:hypothetical protein C8R47DRAFT_434838 [Mycena vitilis]